LRKRDALPASASEKSMRAAKEAPLEFSAHAQGLDHCQLAITDTIKNVSRTLSGYTNVDLHRDAVYVLPPPGLLWLRQRSASLDSKGGNGRQLVSGSGNARSVVNRKPLRQGASGYKREQHNQKTHAGDP
jgi:hypothetical protein